MSEDTKKIEKSEQEPKGELPQQELDKVAGGDCATPKFGLTQGVVVNPAKSAGGSQMEY